MSLEPKMRISVLKKVHFFLKDLLISKIYSLCTNNNSDKIFMFHSIIQGETDSSSYSSSIGDFERLLVYLKSNFNAFSLYDLVTKSHKNGFAITFDDGYAGVYDLAFPVLCKHGIPFTVFVTTDYIGTPGYLSYRQLMSISECKLCTIGSHTVNHPMLRFCKDGFFEIRESKHRLENLLKHEIDLFAYPYGSVFACSHKNVKCVKRCGFRYAFSAVDLPLNCISKKRKFFIPRINGDTYIEKNMHSLLGGN